MKIKSILFILVLCMSPLLVQAQGIGTTVRTTEYADFKPAMVRTVKGQVVTVGQANILLKRSTLIYRSASRRILEAAMGNIQSVDFDDRHYDRIDSMLAWRVDTLGSNALYCVKRIDMEALKNIIINNRQMTDVELNSLQLGITTLDISDSDLVYPLVYNYFFKLDGKFVRCQERELNRHVSKQRRQAYKVALSMPNFSWTSRQSLMDVLRAIAGGK